MRYLLMLYANEKVGAQISPAEMGTFMDQMHAYAGALAKADAFVSTGALMPSDAACTVRFADGEMNILEGPYAETREQLGGYFIINAPDMDAAQKWAARCPAATWGVIEIRPIRDMPSA